MPKIRISETDKTGRVQQSAISNVVYVPIRLNSHASAGQLNKNSKDYSLGLFSNIQLFRSATDFETAAETIVKVKVATESGGGTGTTAEETSYDVAIINKKSLGYKLCKHLLNIGFEVLVEALSDSDTPSWNALKDKSLYDIRFLTLGALVEGAVTGGKSEFDLTGQVSDMIAAAKTRGDCIALVNANETADDFSYTATDVRGKFSSISDGEYAAAFTPWFYTKNLDFFYLNSEDDDEDDINIPVAIPAAFGYLFAYANATKNNPEWYAIAGFERGIIPELSGVFHEYSTADVEVLQARSATAEVELDDKSGTDNVGYAINPICYVRPAGHIIYGNRTLRINDANKKLIATSFLNIRNGLCAIKKLMYEASRKYTFEQNTETLWINFQSYITPLLDKMQSGNGILGYTFIKQKADAKARLKARLNLVPVEAVEDFDLEVYLTDDLTVSE